MDLTIGDLAVFLKQLIPSDIPETYEIHPMFTHLASEENIREGVLAYRGFLYRFCDFLASDEELSQTLKKGKKRFSDETTLTVEFPFVNNVKSILMNIIEYGLISEKSDSILMSDGDRLSLKRSYNKNSTAKISTPQTLKVLRVLSHCGFNFNGIDLQEKKPDINSIEIIYPENSKMLIGFEALGLAQIELSSRKNDEILLRCDYRMLQKENEDISSHLADFMEPLNSELENLVMDFHKRYLELGMTCELDLGSLCTRLIYYYKKKPIWRFLSSLHNGYRLVVKTKNTDRYEEVVETFPKPLSTKIFTGYGCDRKSGTGHGNCQKGCEGYRFPLDNSLLDLKDNITTWLDNEIFSMQTRKKRGK